MSGSPISPTKLSVRERLRQRFRPTRRASSPTPAPVSCQALTSLVVQSPSSPSTQILASSRSPSAKLVAANTPNPSVASSSSQPATPHPSPSNNILDNALKRLLDCDRATLREYVLPTSNDADLALRQALAAAEKKQLYCMEKRWTFTFAGRTVTLKEEADKVIRWLNRFKAVGDVAVNADPLHAGLPWAGIRLVLEVRAI
jgi:hypothetical protein